MQKIILKHYTLIVTIILTLICFGAVSAYAVPTKEFTVVLDAGHGGKDHGAIDNGIREKDINLAVALRVGELIKKHLKNTKVIYTRDNDTFISLQGRADIANKAKGDLFISIHTNSVDLSNKNRKNIAGASVYTQGGHKDEANLAVAKRENSVIELENGFEQKYSGFDPNKVESYIIFEMAAKHNIAQSNRFAKSVQQNLVKTAGRKDRGVHQAGFWVLWATSMPSALIELDFICNPESAAFMNSSKGVDKLAEAIFDAVKEYEANFREKQRMIAGDRRPIERRDKSVVATVEKEEPVYAINAGVDTSNDKENINSTPILTDYATVSRGSVSEVKDLSHANLQITKNQTRARHAIDGRRRRSASAAANSEARNLEVNNILIQKEHVAEIARIEQEEDKTVIPEKQPESISKVTKKDKKAKKQKELASKQKVEKGKDNRKWVAQINNAANKTAKKGGDKISNEFKAAKKEDTARHAGARKSLKSSR